MVFLFLAVAFVPLHAQSTSFPFHIKVELISSSTQYPAVQISWYGLPIASPLPVYYSVYRSDATNNKFKLLFNKLSVFTILDSMIIKGSSYSYYVTASLRDTLLGCSDTATIKIGPLQPPATKTASIHGLVHSDGTFMRLPNVMVEAININSTTPASVCYTDSSGNYALAVLPGNYYLYFFKTGYAYEYYDDQPTIASAKLLSLKAGDSLNADAGLKVLIPPPDPIPCFVFGYVTDDNTALPLPNTKVTIMSWLNSVPGTEVVTDSNGFFKESVHAGEYSLYFEKDGYTSEYFDNQPTIKTATKFILQTGDTIFAKVGLSPSRPPVSKVAYIYGTVVVDNTNAPLAKVAVSAISLLNAVPGMVAYTGEDGKYLLKTAPGDFYLYFTKDGYTPEYFDNQSSIKTAIKLSLRAGDSVFAGCTLSPKTTPPPVPGTAWLCGFITDATTGAPLPHVGVQAIGSLNCYFAPSVKTDSTGMFSINVRSMADYYLYFSKNEYISQYYDNQPTFKTATKITPKTGDSILLKAALLKVVKPATYTIKGNVAGDNNNPVKAIVSIFRLRNSTYHWSNAAVKTDSSGNYSFQAHANDTLVLFVYPLNRDFISQYYNDKKTFNEADRLVISGNLTDINFILAHKLTLPNGISGLVRDSSGNPVQAHVAAYHLAKGKFDKQYAAVADSTGKYAFGNIPPGGYILKVYPMNNYRPTYFRYDEVQTLSWKKADSVMVDSSTLLTDINFSVIPRADSGFSIVHGVVRSNNMEIPGVCVYILDAADNLISYGITDEKGSYLITDLVAGTYRLLTDIPQFGSTTINPLTLDATKSDVEININLSSESATMIESGKKELIKTFTLDQNYPNPFNPETTIRYSLLNTAQVKLSVYDYLGREVATLVDSEQQPGTYSTLFRAKDISSGVYLYKLQVGHQILSRKLTFLK